MKSEATHLKNARCYRTGGTLKPIVLAHLVEFMHLLAIAVTVAGHGSEVHENTGRSQKGSGSCRTQSGIQPPPISTRRKFFLGFDIQRVTPCI